MKVRQCKKSSRPNLKKDFKLEIFILEDFNVDYYFSNKLDEDGFEEENKVFEQKIKMDESFSES